MLKNTTTNKRKKLATDEMPKTNPRPTKKSHKKIDVQQVEFCQNMPSGCIESFEKVTDGITTINVGEVGHRVAVRGKDGNWCKGTVVKLNRSGILQLYKVLSITVLYDHDDTGTHKVPASNVVSLNEDRQEVRYWTSGTPCMRKGDSVDAHARKGASAVEAQLAARASMQKPSKIGPFAGSPATARTCHFSTGFAWIRRCVLVGSPEFVHITS